MTQTINKVFIATSIDGYIADKNGGLDWLNSIPNPDHIDMGYNEFITDIDAIVMGRKTFETVCNFDIEWPYSKPVFVLSTTLKSIPDDFQNKASIIKGNPDVIVKYLLSRGFEKLYIDGGRTIQGFLKEDLIDEIIITTIPILLGGGSRLFSTSHNMLGFDLIESKVFLNQMVQSHYKRK